MSLAGPPTEQQALGGADRGCLLAKTTSSDQSIQSKRVSPQRLDELIDVSAFYGRVASAVVR